MKTVWTVLQHAYIWIWLVLFALPFVATALHSFEAPGGGYSTIAYSDALGSFKDSLILSVELTRAGDSDQSADRDSSGLCHRASRHSRASGRSSRP